MVSKRVRSLAIAAFALAVTVAPAIAQQRSADGYVTARRLGGTTSFYRPALTDPNSVKRMADSPNMATDIRKVLSDAGIPQTGDAVVAMLSGASTAANVGSCSNAAPADGTLVECNFANGDTLDWMAYRPNAPRNRTAGRVEKMRWGGRTAFPAFLFRVTSAERIYTFVVPKACGNLSLMSVRTVERPAVVIPPPPAAAPPPAPAPPPPAPPPARAPEPAPMAMPPTIAPVAVAKGSPFFFDLLAGKDRRVREIGDRSTNDGRPIFASAGPGEFAQCSPLLGVKLGVAKRFTNDWELAAAAGVAFSLVSQDDKVREHQVLFDVEANKYLDNGVFLGTGLSFWDITHSDNFTPAALVHVGVPITKSQSHPLYFLVEGRYLLDHADDIRNNYQFWGGIRLHF